MRFAVPLLVLIVCLVTLWHLVVTPWLLARKARKKQAKLAQPAEVSVPTYPEADATDLNPDNWGTPT